MLAYDDRLRAGRAQEHLERAGARLADHLRGRAAHTPLLVVIGLLDTCATYVHAIEFFKAVAENGTDARLLADAQAGNDPNDPSGIIVWQ